MKTFRVEFFSNGSWLSAFHDFDGIEAEYGAESEATKDVAAQNEYERSEGELETCFRIV